VNLNFGKLWDSAQHMIDGIMARLPSLVVAIAVFIPFYILSIFVRRIIRSAIRAHRQNLGMAFARLIGAGIILLGFWVAFSIVAPSFQAGDVIKVLGIGSVAIGFAFQNILQNFPAGLLLLRAEPFVWVMKSGWTPMKERSKRSSHREHRVCHSPMGTRSHCKRRREFRGIKVCDHQCSETCRRRRRVVIPNADLFTHSCELCLAASHEYGTLFQGAPE